MFAGVFLKGEREVSCSKQSKNQGFKLISKFLTMGSCESIYECELEALQQHSGLTGDGPDSFCLNKEKAVTII